MARVSLNRYTPFPGMTTALNSVKQKLSRQSWVQLSTAASIALSALAVAYVIEFLVLAFIRMGYPFELEWIEGAYADEVRWIAAGHFPYVPPSIFFIPTSKTPLFFYLSAALTRVFGVSFVAPRLVSILATTGCFLLLYLIVSREAKRSIPGIIAAGLYAASYRFAGAWMDLAKTDSLFLFLILAAFFTSRRYQSWKGMVASGLLFTAAYFTKQMTLPIVLTLAPVSLIVSRGRTWPQWLSAGVAGVVGFLGLNVLSDGWFSFYTFNTVTLHSTVPDLFLFWKAFLIKMWPAFLIAVFYAATVLSGSNPLRWNWPENAWHHLGLSIALVLASWSIFFKVWTYDNGFLPACAGMATLTGLGYAAIMKLDRPLWRWAVPPTWLKLAATALVFCQFALLFYNPLDQLPTRKDRANAERFVSFVKELPGEVFVFNHGFVNYLAGKTPYLHSSPYGDVVGGVDPVKGSDSFQRREQVKTVYNQALEEQVFDWVIVDKPETSWLPYYIYVKDLFDEPGAFYPVTGALSRPESLMVKNPVARGGSLPLNDANLDGLFLDGWSPAQSWGRSMIGSRSTLQIGLEKKHDYQVVVEFLPECAGDQLQLEKLIILWNEEQAAEQNLAGCGLQSLNFNLSKDRVSKGINLMALEFEKALSTSAAGIEAENTGNVRITSLTFIQK